jgi:hypothetical protein
VPKHGLARQVGEMQIQQDEVGVVLRRDLQLEIK